MIPIRCYTQSMENKRIALHVTAAAERALKSGHPWLFDSGIRNMSHHNGQSGDLAVIFDRKDRFLAIGLYDPASPIRVKVLAHQQPTPINAAWFAQQIRAAGERRTGLTNTNGYRLVHGENDGLPGLVVDRYADTLVIKLYSEAWQPHLQHILVGLDDILPGANWVLRSSRALDGTTQVLRGEVDTVIFEENGLRFAADVIHGHKTGFFFDQRHNRLRVRQSAQGLHVLDVFAYSGGFAVNAAFGGAASTTAIDISADALATIQENMALNDLNHVPHVALQGDAFDVLAQLDRRFDMVVVDPPSFAKKRDEVPRALNAYAKLARLAVDVLETGGQFVMASCSSRVSADDFFHTVLEAAPGLRLQETTEHALDHPITFPEGAYLKCLYAHKMR